eukprot:CAMPEP_0182505408 /NCGR_PEP_ID=MMETSP1321-20130603/19161_1 /TAXON_ID=91990 /ORGANISM="Bolidomonas sp., Strain RCC1657" /LENGTH=216 /DNA_ID=CAMNT_0024710941 /DNA_START=146 /DNA_END=795 /DNA_ORIENTATION=+
MLFSAAEVKPTAQTSPVPTPTEVTKRRQETAAAAEKAANHAVTVCDLPADVYAFKKGSVTTGGISTEAINDPEAFTYCSSTTTLSGDDYYPNNPNGATTYWQNGGSDVCWAPYKCTGGTCSPVEIYDGCFDSSGNFRVSNQQDTTSVLSDCADLSFTNNGNPKSVELPLETRKGFVAVQAGGGVIAGAGVLGALLFKCSKGKKRTLEKMVEINGGV